MRIGSLEVSTPTFVHAAIFLALAIFVPSLLLSRLGAIKESWRTDAVQDAETTGGEALDSGIAGCKEMIAADPSKIPPRMHLGCLLLVQKKFADASETFAQASDRPTATDEEKSLAMTAAAGALCLDGSVDGKPRHLDEAERLLTKAVAFRETPDALAALALVKSWKSGPAGNDVQALVKRAFSAEPAPAPGLLKELYKLNGAIKAVNHLPIEASVAFGNVRALDPADKQMEEASRLTLLAGLNAPDLSPDARRAAIKRLMPELDKFGKLRNEALLALAFAWHSFKTEPDYLTAKGPFEKTDAIFNEALEVNPNDPRIYKNLAGLKEERIADLKAELPAVMITGFTGETPHKSTWASKAAASPDHDNPPLAATLTSGEQDLLQKIVALLREEKQLWERLLARPDIAKSEKINAQLRLISCARRLVYLGPWLRPFRCDDFSNIVLVGPEIELLKQAATVGNELALADESGRGSYEYALVLIEQGELSAALNALLESRKHGFKSDEQAKLLAELDVKIEIADAGPTIGERQFGAAPVIRAAFETPLGLNSLKNLKVSINGKDVIATSYGSEIMYIPSAAEMSGGEHVVRFAANDFSGKPIRFPEFAYLVDKDPPTWNVEPSGPSVKVDTVFSVNVKDPSGVDWASLNAGITSAKAGTLNAHIIKDGKYTHSLITAKVKTGEAVERSPFPLTGPSGLSAGDYKVWIEVRDLQGNKLREEKSYTVK